MAKKKRPSEATAAISSDDWRCRADCETLMEAERIKADPKRLKAAKEEAKRQLLRLAPVAAGHTADAC